MYKNLCSAIVWNTTITSHTHRCEFRKCRIAKYHFVASGLILTTQKLVFRMEKKKYIKQASRLLGNFLRLFLLFPNASLDIPRKSLFP